MKQIAIPPVPNDLPPNQKEFLRAIRELIIELKTEIEKAKNEKV